jgi:hypothetical protein
LQDIFRATFFTRIPQNQSKRNENFGNKYDVATSGIYQVKKNLASHRTAETLENMQIRELIFD